MAYKDFKDLARRTASDKVLKDKTFNIAKNPKYDEYQRGHISMIYKFFDKEISGSCANNEMKQNHQLAQELHKRTIKFFLRITACSGIRYNICDANVADMQLIYKFNKGFIVRYWYF